MTAIKRKQICLRIDVNLNSQLIQIAEYEDVSKNKLVEKELKRFVKNYFKDREVDRQY
jgi:predicted HicB family RNase H-like nuclease